MAINTARRIHREINAKTKTLTKQFHRQTPHEKSDYTFGTANNDFTISHSPNKRQKIYKTKMARRFNFGKFNSSGSNENRYNTKIHMELDHVTFYFMVVCSQPLLPYQAW